MEEEDSTCSSLSSFTEPPRAWAGLWGPSPEGTELTYPEVGSEATENCVCPSQVLEGP